MHSVLDSLRRLVRSGGQGDSPDSQLVDRFTTCRDESAFEALLQRHGPLVWGVCRRRLKDAHLAEDAFQATFLVLAREAHTIRNRQSLGSWLYAVANRVALRTRSVSIRLEQQHQQETAMQGPDAVTELIRRELRPVLDEELERLPEKYRSPLILCHLQGKTHEQAARELGCPSGTMSRRLDKGRELLRKRLEVRGLTLGAALLATVLADEAAAAVPDGLSAATRQAAVKANQVAASTLVSTQEAAFAQRTFKVAAGVTLLGAAVVMGAALVYRAASAVAIEPAPKDAALLR
jgi:RNA polymerase sigma factor (sigma-70 family)